MAHGWRKGLTFIEAIAAAAILGLLAAVVFGAFGGMMNSQERQVRRLACAELANRLILQYLDSREELPPDTAPIAYGGELYRWDLRETPVQLTPARPEVAEARAGSSAFTVDRILHVSVRVWLAEDSGGAMQFDATVPNAAMGRLIDPIALRNPDSIENLFKVPDAQRLKGFMDNLNRYSTGGGLRRGSGQAQPNRPASGGGSGGGGTGGGNSGTGGGTKQ